MNKVEALVRWIVFVFIFMPFGGRARENSIIQLIYVCCIAVCDDMLTCTHSAVRNIFRARSFHYVVRIIFWSTIEWCIIITDEHEYEFKHKIPSKVL